MAWGALLGKGAPDGVIDDTTRGQQCGDGRLEGDGTLLHCVVIWRGAVREGWHESALYLMALWQGVLERDGTLLHCV